MLEMMKNIFRIPPTPFHIRKSASQPAVSNPIKARRPSNASSDGTPSRNQIDGIGKLDEQAREMDVEEHKEVGDVDQEASKFNRNGMASTLPRLSSPTPNGKEPSVYNDQEQLDPDSQSPDQVASIFTPPPSSKKRKRRSSERSDEHKKSISRKHRRPRESSIPYPDQLPPKSPSKKRRHNSSESAIPSTPDISETVIEEDREETTSTPSKLTKDERKRLKREKKLARRKKLERQSSEAGSQPITLSSLRHETPRNEDIEQVAVTSTAGRVAHDQLRLLGPDPQSPEPKPKPSAKKRKKQRREVVASVEPQSTKEVDPDLGDEDPASRNSVRNPKRKKDLSTQLQIGYVLQSDEDDNSPHLSAEPVQETGIDEPLFLLSQEIPEYRNTNTLDSNHGSSPTRRKESKSPRRPRTKMHYRSTEKIVDSSVDEDEALKTIPKRRKPKELAQSQASSAKSTADRRTSEEVRSASNANPGKGNYTPAECDVVQREVRNFLLLKKMTTSQFAELLQEECSQHYSHRKTRELSGSIASQLPGRSVLSVTRHLLKKFPVEKLPSDWTEEDDSELRKLVAEKGKRWTVIASEMGRSPELVRLRYQDYVSLGKQRKRGKWEDHERQKLRDIVFSLLEESGWEEEMGCQTEVVSRFLDWGTVSKRMGDRSRLQCYWKWIDVANKED